MEGDFFTVIVDIDFAIVNDRTLLFSTAYQKNWAL